AEVKAAGIRIRMDDRPDLSPGWKFNEYEMRGVPVRIEFGPRDLENGQAVLVSRVSGEKRSVPLEGLADAVQTMLDDVHAELYNRALTFMNENLRSANTLDELKANDEKLRGFVLA